MPATLTIVLAIGLWVAPHSNGQVSSERDERPARDKPSTIGGAELADGEFELVDGDRVVLLGSGFIEAEQEFGYLELALTTRWPDRNVIFRNVGWSGDTVSGDARARFTSPPTPYERLLEDATKPDPTVIFVGYGSTVPFEGLDATGAAEERVELVVARFEDGLRQLIGDLERETGARIVLLSPSPLEADMSSAPGDFVGQATETLHNVSAVIERVANDHGHAFVDVFSGLSEVEEQIDAPITADGVQLNALAYFHLARIIEEGLGLPPRGWSFFVDPASEVVEADETGISDFQTSRSPAGPAERLRRLIIQKNKLYFQQYRPPNETYLVGFRAYEQGQNADELDRLTPLIEKKEREIARLRHQAARTLEIEPTGGR